ncbi:hypothetical protein D9758_008290 [Tetrapyrgos nigripes]|uniref:orotate phosphoribosyltransferase n=1 Tax=Tetrapyrgos nigripes TaxID=182062 RepID=A0A8H5G1G9_9AGAR|nr:hypothetical protein D9758_008290 [Tetrapyrgos nigripes]
MSSKLESYQTDLISKAMSVGALKFGQFTLKSGRISPYFFNAGLLSSGEILTSLASAFSATIHSAQTPSSSNPHPIPQFDVLFGPAYKGIPFAAITVVQLFSQYNISVGLAYDRKEVKDHGEGGNIVGASLRDKKVLILDDVMTAGTAVRAAIDMVRKEGGQIVGVVQCLDREEVGKDGVSSTVKDVEEILGAGSVRSILKMRDLMVWLERDEMQEELGKMKEYRDKHGLK